MPYFKNNDTNIYKVRKHIEKKYGIIEDILEEFNRLFHLIY